MTGLALLHLYGAPIEVIFPSPRKGQWGLYYELA